MKLENGYKVLYVTPVKNEITGKVVEFNVSASTTGLFEDADPIMTVAKDVYKLIYEKDGKIYGSTKNIPTIENGVSKDVELKALNEKVFTEVKPVDDGDEASAVLLDDGTEEQEIIDNVETEEEPTAVEEPEDELEEDTESEQEADPEEE